MRVQVVAGEEWFDIDAATSYNATDDSSDTLYKTESGNYVLAEVVDEESGGVACRKINKDDACHWLLKNGLLDALPEEERDKRKI